MNAQRLMAFLLLQVLTLTCRGVTLRQFLSDNSIPTASFSQSELEEQIQGLATKHDKQTMVAIQYLEGELLSGPLVLLKYEPNHPLFRSSINMSSEDACHGSVLGFEFLDGYTLVSTHINPSAGCLLVLDKDLKLVNPFYGFSPVQVKPDGIVIIEDMIHFAPVHPERLQLADLSTGKTQELYPPQGDLLRAELAHENAQDMPSEETCARMNDPCDAKVFDEDIRSLATDGKGEFAFLSVQSASHATVAETAPDSVASQTVFYLYRQEEGSWRYCEQSVNDAEAASVESQLRLDFSAATARCKPALAVIPDLSTAGNNPFLTQ